jgi:sugar phosphate isomerase/epimerase
MIKCNNWPISVCTWSLQNDFEKLSCLRDQTEVNHLHLGMSPALEADGDKYLSKIESQGWNITATMMDFPQEDYSTLDKIKITGGIIPDDCWPGNRKRLIDGIAITADLGVKYLSFHLGFIDMEDQQALGKIKDRTIELADEAKRKNIMLLFETGQETAEELKSFLELVDHPTVGVNFDPANMILYDKGYPDEAIQVLKPWIKHLHIKDAIRTSQKGTWGQEVPWASGEVGGNEFLRILKRSGYAGAVAVEREAGDDRMGDIKSAIESLKSFAD